MSSTFGISRVASLTRLLAALVWLAMATGCSSWNLSQSVSWPFGKDEKPGKPDKVVAIWTDTVLTQVDEAPQRGFGGRLMFYEGKNESPVKAEGTLVIYAFDETRREGNTAKPDRKYVFSPDQLPAHYSKSKIGHSYSVWLPWDEVGGPQKEISLIVRFESKGGAVAVGDPSRHMLPGQNPPPRSNQAAAMPAAGNVAPGYLANASTPAGWGNPPASIAGNGAVQPVSYESPVMPQGSWTQQDAFQARRMTTATIAIPAGMAPGPAFTSPPAVPPVGPWPGSGDAAVGAFDESAAGIGGADVGLPGVATDDFTGLADFDVSAPATTISFCTCSIPASRRTIRSANSRSCCVATAPRRIAVRPWISTWLGVCQCRAGVSASRSASDSLSFFGLPGDGSKATLKTVRIELVLVEACWPPLAPYAPVLRPTPRCPGASDAPRDMAPAAPAAPGVPAVGLAPTKFCAFWGLAPTKFPGR